MEKYKVTVPEIFKEALDQFLTIRREDFNNLKESLVRKAWSEVREISHKIKGSSATYGFVEWTKISGEMEDILITSGLNPSSDEINNLKKSVDDFIYQVDNLEITFED